MTGLGGGGSAVGVQPGSRLGADVDRWRPRTTRGNGRSLGRSWRELLEESMKEAAEEEKRNAIERGSFHEGVPAIAVIVDGGGANAHTNIHTM